MDQVQTIR